MLKTTGLATSCQLLYNFNSFVGYLFEFLGLPDIIFNVI